MTTRADIERGIGRMLVAGCRPVAARFILAAGLVLASMGNGTAQQNETGSVTGLTLPRYASLKADRVNVRRGPGREYAIAWVYRRVGLPVEIIAEVGTWRQVRDSDGDEGWIFAGLLSGRRTGIVSPWTRTTDGPRPENIPIRYSASTNGQRLALLEPGTIVGAHACDGTWCQVSINRIRGYVPQVALWGIYPNERFD